MCDKFRAKKGRPVPCNNDDSIRFPRGWVAAADDGEIYGWESFKERGLYTPGMEDKFLAEPLRGTSLILGTLRPQIKVQEVGERVEAREVTGATGSSDGERDHHITGQLSPASKWAAAGQ
ncbi:hypothetical protein LSAT2_002513 [Lamellibrachia satsuma]|nr:hypothetical protein LSAT2_002513 [Lamellibrachia satsuma]